MKQHTKNYGVYLWDTFEEPGDDTFFMAEFDSIAEAEKYVGDTFNTGGGADYIEIVDAEGTIVTRYKITGRKW